MCGRIGSALKDGIKEGNKFRPDTLLVIANLVEVGLPKV
jgi:hypothetical protein